MDAAVTSLFIYADTGGDVQLWAPHPAPKAVPALLDHPTVTGRNQLKV